MISKLFKIAVICMIVSSPVLAQENPNAWSLEKCVEYAMQNNLSMELGRLGIESNRVAWQQNKANRFPTANLNGSYGSNWGRSINPTTNDFVARQNFSSSWNLSSSVTVFNWGNINNRIKQADQNLEASQYDFEKTENDVILNVVSFYVNVIFNRELVENARLQLDNTEQQLDRINKQVQVGALPLTNLLDIQAQKSTNELSLINAQNSLELAILQLKQVMQMPATEPLEIVIPQLEVEENPVIEMNANQVYESALQNMPEIKSADIGTSSADLGMKISRAALYPTIRLNAGMGSNYSDFITERFVPNGTFSTVDSDSDGIPDTQPIGLVQNSGETVVTPVLIPGGNFEDFGFFTQLQENRSTFASIGISIPLFNGLNSRSNLQRAIIAQKQAEVTATQVRNTLRQTIERAFNDVAAASKAYSQSLQQVDALEESFRVTEQRYNLQAINFFDYQVASNNLFIARSNLLRAKYDFIFKQKILDFYLDKPLTFN
jgi:outer membrane protein